MAKSNRCNARLIFYITLVVLLLVGISYTFKMGLKNHDLQTLRLISIVFRHGERTPDAMWPKYENQKENFYPYGLGELTNQGKQRAYNIGLQLRKRYDAFLGDILLKDTVMAKSSSYSRTKTSLSYALAGLYPPHGVNKWDNHLQWQAIPYSYNNFPDDKVFFGCLSEKSKQIFANIRATKEFQDEFRKFENMSKHCAEHTGWDMGWFINVARLYYELLSMENLNYALPEWTKTVYPEPLKAAVEYFYATFTSSDAQLQISGGFLLREIVTEMENTMIGRLPDRKIIVYSGHDINVASILKSVNLFDNHAPTFGEYVVLELHETEPGNFAVRVLLQDYKQEEAKVLTIPGCQEKCPLNAFYEIIKNKLPT